MIPRILTTDGDSHSPEAWAALTADMIFPIDPDIAPERRPLAMKIQAEIAMALVEHHDGVIRQERSKLQASGDNHLHAPHQTKDAADAAVQAIKEAVKGTPWEQKWQDPKVVQVAHSLVAGHMGDAQRIERLWYSNPNPHAVHTRNAKLYGTRQPSEHARAYYDAHTQGQGDKSLAQARLKLHGDQPQEQQPEPATET